MNILRNILVIGFGAVLFLKSSVVYATDDVIFDWESLEKPDAIELEAATNSDEKSVTEQEARPQEKAEPKKVEAESSKKEALEALRGSEASPETSYQESSEQEPKSDGLEIERWPVKKADADESPADAHSGQSGSSTKAHLLIGGTITPGWDGYVQPNASGAGIIEFGLSEGLSLEIEAAADGRSVSLPQSQTSYGFQSYSLGTNLKLSTEIGGFVRPFLGIGLAGIVYNEMQNANYPYSTTFVGAAQGILGAEIMLSSHFGIVLRSEWILPALNTKQGSYHFAEDRIIDSDFIRWMAGIVFGF